MQKKIISFLTAAMLLTGSQQAFSQANDWVLPPATKIHFNSSGAEAPSALPGTSTINGCGPGSIYLPVQKTNTLTDATGTGMTFVNNCGTYKLPAGTNINGNSYQNVFVVPGLCKTYYAIAWETYRSGGPSYNKLVLRTLDASDPNALTETGSTDLLLDYYTHSGAAIAVAPLAADGSRKVYISDNYNIKSLTINATGGTSALTTIATLGNLVETRTPMEVTPDGSKLLMTDLSGAVLLYDITAGTFTTLSGGLPAAGGVRIMSGIEYVRLPGGAERVYMSFHSWTNIAPIAGGLYYVDLANPATAVNFFASYSPPVPYGSFNFGFSEIERGKNGKLYLAINPNTTTVGGGYYTVSSGGNLYALDAVSNTLSQVMNGASPVVVNTYEGNTGYDIQQQIDGEDYSYTNNATSPTPSFSLNGQLMNYTSGCTYQTLNCTKQALPLTFNTPLKAGQAYKISWREADTCGNILPFGFVNFTSDYYHYNSPASINLSDYGNKLFSNDGSQGGVLLITVSVINACGTTVEKKALVKIADWRVLAPTFMVNGTPNTAACSPQILACQQNNLGLSFSRALASGEEAQIEITETDNCGFNIAGGFTYSSSWSTANPATNFLSTGVLATPAMAGKYYRISLNYRKSACFGSVTVRNAYIKLEDWKAQAPSYTINGVANVATPSCSLQHLPCQQSNLSLLFSRAIVSGEDYKLSWEETDSCGNLVSGGATYTDASWNTSYPVGGLNLVTYGSGYLGSTAAEGKSFKVTVQFRSVCSATPVSKVAYITIEDWAKKAPLLTMAGQTPVATPSCTPQLISCSATNLNLSFSRAVTAGEEYSVSWTETDSCGNAITGISYPNVTYTSTGTTTFNLNAYGNGTLGSATAIGRYFELTVNFKSPCSGKIVARKSYFKIADWNRDAPDYQLNGLARSLPTACSPQPVTCPLTDLHLVFNPTLSATMEYKIAWQETTNPCGTTSGAIAYTTDGWHTGNPGTIDLSAYGDSSLRSVAAEGKTFRVTVSLRTAGCSDVAVRETMIAIGNWNAKVNLWYVSNGAGLVRTAPGATCATAISGACRRSPSVSFQVADLVNVDKFWFEIYDYGTSCSGTPVKIADGASNKYAPLPAPALNNYSLPDYIYDFSTDPGLYDDLYFRSNPGHLIKVVVFVENTCGGVSQKPGYFYNSNTACRSMEETTGIGNEDMEEGALLLTPNPAGDHVVIKAQTTNTRSVTAIELYDVAGRKVSTIRTDFKNNQSFTVNVRDIPAGLYIYKYTVGQNVKSGKLMIVH